MRKVLMRLVISAVCVLSLALPGVAGQLDDYYLSAFAQRQPGSALEKAILSAPARQATAVRSGTPLLHSLKRDWDKLAAGTRQVLAKQLAAPVLSGTPTTLLSSGGHFAIHYTATGSDAPQVNDYSVGNVLYHGINYYTGLHLNSAADWAGKVGDAFEAAYSFYLGNGGLGYHPPANFPGTPFDVYLQDLGAQGYYGLTQSDQPAASANFPYAYTAYIQLDKDFTNPLFTPDAYSPLQSLDVTSVHEFHHAVQYGYNYYFDIWYAEATSTWFEGERYPDVQQNYDYLAGWFNDTTRQIDLPQSDPDFNGEAYGRWIFNRYLAEKHSTTAIRKVWEKLATVAPPTNGDDIPMVPVLDAVLSASYASSLGSEFFGFVQRLYLGDWPWPTTTVTPLGGIGTIPSCAPVASYANYPVNSASSATPSVTLPHYSFAFYRFVPSASSVTLTITLAKTSGIQALVFQKSRGVISEVPADPGGASYTVSGFNALNPATDEVALLLANTTGLDGQQANFSSDGTTQTVSVAAGPSSSGKSGCFIATAAYGSYLHPKVALLRAFRDDYLLTNPPGRLFVALYYRLSPPIADLIGRHEPLREVTRLLLVPVIFAVEHGRVALLLCLMFLVPIGRMIRIGRAERSRVNA